MDSIGSAFSSGGGGAAAATPASIPADVLSQDTQPWSVFLPPGGSVDTPQGGTAPGSVGSIPGAGGGASASPYAWLGNAAKAGGGIMGLVNMFRTSPTEKALEKGQKLAMQNASAASGAGNQQLQQYTQGQLSPAQQAAVDQFKKESLAKYRQYFANAGIPESTAMMDAEAKVNQDASQYAQQLLQQNYANSMQALGLANNTLAQQAYANLAQEKEIADSQAAAMQAIGQLAGLLG